MLLALNIGNTNVTFGGYDSAGQRVFASRFYSDSALSSDELVYKLVNMLALYHIQPRDVDAAILASVVPVLTSRMREALEKMTNAPLMEVGPGLKSGVRIRMDNPAQLGGELLCAAVGALQTHKPPLLVMNMDTAATLVAVDAEGSIVGGVILLAAAAWMFRKKLDNDWLLWYAVTAVVSVMWFYKQSHDYIILALPAIAIFCLPHISLPAWGSILILLVDVIAFAVPKVCTLLCGLPKDVVSPWAKLLETVAIMATLYYVFQSAKRHAAALQQASQNG